MERVLPYFMPKWAFRIGLWRAYGRVGHAAPQDVDEYWAPTQFPAFIRACCRLSHAFDWSSGDPDELSQVRCRTRVLFGERDHLVGLEACRPFVERIRHASVEVVAGAGHTLPEEVPDVVNRAVIAAAHDT